MPDILRGLDKEQERAVTLKTNGVVSAGAGSGKTKVLAGRYVWLVTEKNLKPDEILTLTFTNKAVSEMYSRIYQYLLAEADHGDAKAGAALKDFHKARISTLDSFSAGIARTAAARYGISPDFSNDDAALGELARETALAFVLDNREDPAIRELLVDHKIQDLAVKIFARVVLRYSPVSSPLGLEKILAAQKRFLLDAWRKLAPEAERITGLMIDGLRGLAETKKTISFTESLGGILLKNTPPPAPDIVPLLETGPLAVDSGPDPRAAETRRALQKYSSYYSALTAIHLPGRYGEAYGTVVEYFRQLKGRGGDGLYHKLESIADYALSFRLCAGLSRLIEKFQAGFNARKREAGLLSFNDTAHLAVDALRDHPDIRKVYKDSLKMIMVDEFQDNNALQRDLIYLLAENPDRAEKGLAAPADLEKNRMFFVGDEKQSIYRFRGADVTVFRSLGKNLFGGAGIGLKHNYRSSPGLTAAFNRIFGGLEESSPEETGNSGGVFLPPGPDVPDYEAAYSRILPPEDSGGSPGDDGEKNAPVHFCFLDGEELPGDGSSGIKSQDLEAVFIAEKIRQMVNGKEKIPKKTDRGTEWVECTWKDFAVLIRSYTHQDKLEKYFRESGVPYSTGRPAGLFNDAPVLDLRAYLRLLVYPGDRIAYAALIRSPFMRLSDLTLAVCMLNKDAEPFAGENEALIPGEDLEAYRQARERYQSLRAAALSLPVTGLLTKLWFEEGYRFETLWPEAAQVYGSLFDFFFSLASASDRQGKSPAEFIEYLDDVMNREEKPDDKDIPGEGEPGVRIMSIHKSKGLEFPVVFIFDCSHSGNIRASADLVDFHEKYGLVFNLPRAEEMTVGGNYFRGLLQEEEKAKDIAELRRLLYVAMTRAEAGLFLTFTLPAQTKDEKKEWDMAEEISGGDLTRETVLRRLDQLRVKSGDSPGTFLALLAPVISGCPACLCCLETIPVLTRREIRLRAMKQDSAVERSAMTRQEAVLAAAAFYEQAVLPSTVEDFPMNIDASSLRYRARNPEGTAPGDNPAAGMHGKEFDPLDSLLEKAGLGPADFGSLVHAVLEARLNGKPLPDQIPGKIRPRLGGDKSVQQLLAAAEALAGKFLASDLGKSCAASPYRETEFAVISSVTAGGKAIAVTGRIDLLFGENGGITVVDFKTDRAENPGDHYGQLAAYYRAIGDISGKPVSAWLFYLRSGRAFNVTGEVKNVCLEELALTALTEG